MASASNSEGQLENKDVEKKRLSQGYFVAKSGSVNKETDIRLLENIWSFIRDVPNIDLSEIEIDAQNGKVTLFGTFTDKQLQGRVLHGIMNLQGVIGVDDQSHILEKHQLKDYPQEDNIRNEDERL